MAKNKSVVLLGYEDELITEKHKQFVDFSTSKIGGDANWPSGDIKIPCCPICNLQRPLIAQIYAPLDNSAFHRTLYVFACLNAPCSNQSQAWLCVRTQLLEKFNEVATTTPRAMVTQPAATVWCSSADDWGDDDDDIGDVAAPANDFDNNNCSEENGNVIKFDNCSKMSDEDDESNSLENETTLGLENLVMEDNNANCGAQGGVINNRICALNASAEIDGEESELVSVETPIRPQRDLISLMAASQTISSKEILTLQSFFVAVDEERPLNGAGVLSDHVRDLLQEYQSKDDVKSSPDTPTGGAMQVIGNIDQETYEKGIPVHGDVMFHGFLTKIQENYGQIIRYSRNSMPLLIAPIKEQLPKCSNCGGETICELQILPTLIPKLRLASNETGVPLEFGNCLIFTCRQSCWDTPDKMRLESVIIQQEF